MIDSSTELARERSREAADRTLMACIRTALALEFGVGKFYGYLHDARLHERLDPIRSMLSFGASFIAGNFQPARGGSPTVRTPTNMKGE
jgi:putative membrane protein